MMYHEERLDDDLKALAPTVANFLNLDDIPLTRVALADLFAQLEASTETPAFDDVVTRDETVPGPKGAPAIMVRVYRPKGSRAKLPAIYYIHGGGMVLGSVSENDLTCKTLVREVKCVVVSVEYRLAPEHPYPAPIEDCYAGLKWLADNAAALKVDPKRIAVMGASAGGGLAAGLCLLARDRKEISVAYQMLIYPMIDDTNVQSAKQAKNDFYVWSRANNLAGWQAYLGKKFGADNVPIYAAPSRAKKLAGLPPAYISVGDMDLFLLEDLDYARKLAQADVAVELHVYPGAFHGFDTLASAAVISQRANHDVYRALKHALR